MDPPAPSKKDDDQHSAIAKVLHGRSAMEPNSFWAAMKKDGKSNQMMTDSYLKHWEASHDDEAQESRTTQYASLVNR
jgi:hypothetical protein